MQTPQYHQFHNNPQIQEEQTGGNEKGDIQVQETRRQFLDWLWGSIFSDNAEPTGAAVFFERMGNNMQTQRTPHRPSEILAEEDAMAVWQTPYSPDHQPIELLWALVKRFAAASWHEKRTISDLIEQLKVGFYGGITENGCTTLGAAANVRVRMLIDHAIKKIAEAADNDPELANHEGFAGIFLNPRSEASTRIERMLKSTQKADGHESLDDYWAPQGEIKSEYGWASFSVPRVPKRSKVGRPKKEIPQEPIKKRGWKQITKAANHWDRKDFSQPYNIFDQLKVLEDREEFENIDDGDSESE